MKVSAVDDVWVNRSGERHAKKVLARKAISPYVEICHAHSCVSNLNSMCNAQIVQIGKKGECLMFVEQETVAMPKPNPIDKPETITPHKNSTIVPMGDYVGMKLNGD